VDCPDVLVALVFSLGLCLVAATCWKAREAEAALLRDVEATRDRMPLVAAAIEAGMDDGLRCGKPGGSSSRLARRGAGSPILPAWNKAARRRALSPEPQRVERLFSEQQSVALKHDYPRPVSGYTAVFGPMSERTRLVGNPGPEPQATPPTPCIGARTLK
jgi:hypothetical protein